MATPAKIYRKVVLKLCKARTKFEFLNQCRLNGVFPMSIHRIRLPIGCDSLLPKLKVLCLSKAIRSTRRKYYSLVNTLIKIEDEFYNEDRTLLKEVNTRVLTLADSVERNLRRKYIKKIKWLFKCQNVRPRRRKTLAITAWDNISPPQCLIDALEYGPFFAPTPPLTPENIIPNIELLIKGMNITKQDYIRWKTRFWAESEKQGNKEERRFNKSIKEARDWLHMNDIVLIKADKSKGIVLLKRETYNQKINEHINNTECLIAPGNYLETLQQRIRKFMCTPLANCLNMERGIIRAPRAPRIFAFGKTHKPGSQLRPVVEKCNAPTFGIEKRLVKFIRDKIKESPYSIKNSLQLVQKLENITLKDEELMTVLNYKALYPSIKLPPCFCALRDFLFANIKNAIKYHKHILELSDLICHTSFFEFEGKTYLQGRGVPMGSPMSAVLCELVLRKLESDILPYFQNDIIIYARYVDDIFVLWKNNRNTHRFISLINSNPYGLTLELDQESENIVNFLDLTITCKEGEIKTNIYRKPVYQPIIIPKNSSDPEHIKLAAFRSWITRAYTHCTSIYDTHKELEYIRSIAEQQGYGRKAIDALIARMQKRNRQQRATELRERIVINYHPSLNKIIKKVARNRNVKIIYRRNPTVYKLLRNDKKRYERNNMTGVYSIPMKDHRFNSDLVYIGPLPLTNALLVRLSSVLPAWQPALLSLVHFDGLSATPPRLHHLPLLSNSCQWT
ncbi:uncharacterized protein LOC111614732 [Centruroides sculpturatus]|uniref:uncharacterized protein LOC111614732 n=1 Tax=Centruroides sculpturatus TaxID=218467 RepID=UPI000C6D2659|nr:uncharacterized protein LOC111614732 [Centruroides sculpturatus]